MNDSFGGHRLAAHPKTLPRAVENLSFKFAWTGAGRWVLEFHTSAPASSLMLPALAEPTRADELWKHTCCELFLLDPAHGSYFEFNFSPSGRWAAYRFDGYRKGMRDLEVRRPRISASLPAEPHFHLRVDFEDPALRNPAPWRAGVSAVIEEADGTKSYWALAHPKENPDFHDEDGFTLELPAA
jgi:hypothetical protein